ncbi:YbaB/EbfC family nucleoid-associated protein [Dactylosporangium sp. CA-233914]|uniref:YbaB/EbfC family nucleoid-associated protein n=1 Tax=Dactylosporangium sp. CA-233914 TaxID=3239934 RepID=UPI003D8B1BBF
MAAEQVDLSDFLERARALQGQVASLQETMLRTEVTGTAGGGVVAITMSAVGEFLSVHLDPETVASSMADELEDLVLAALRDAAEQLRRRADERIGALTDSLNDLADH